MVELKKKVTLRTKTPTANVEAPKPQVTIKPKQPKPPITPTPDGDGSGGKAKWYAAALAGLLVLGGGGYYLSQQGDESDTPMVELIEPAKSPEATGGGATDANQDEQIPTDANDEVADNVSDEAAEGETPAQLGQSQGDVSPANNDTPAPVDEAHVINNTSTGGTVSRTNPTPTANVTGTVEEEAREVIRGKYGNGAVRKRNLGDRYAEIQSKVNEMYKNGLVH